MLATKIMAAAKDKVVFVTKEEESEASEGFASDDSAGEAPVTKARLHTHTRTHTRSHTVVLPDHDHAQSEEAHHSMLMSCSGIARCFACVAADLLLLRALQPKRMSGWGQWAQMARLTGTVRVCR